MSNFATQFNTDKEKYAAQKSDWFTIKEGDNKIRVLVEPAKMFEKFKRGIVYKGCDFATEATMKYLTHVLDYADTDRGENEAPFPKIKVMKIPYSIMEQIVGYMTNEEYAFSAFPMPYDITIKATNAGTKEVSYTVIPARNNSDVDEKTVAELAKKKPPTEIVDKMQENQIKKDKEAGVYVSPEEQGERIRKELAAKQGTESFEDIIEYPVEELNPNDIPF